MQAKHEAEGASKQLASGWKVWLAERGGEAAGAQAVAAVVGGDTIEVLDLWDCFGGTVRVWDTEVAPALPLACQAGLGLGA